MIQSTRERLDKIFDKKIFFIAGFTRPGTNWLQRALNAHPDILCNGDGHFTDLLYPALCRTLGNYNQQTIRSKSLLEQTGDQGLTADLSFGDLDFLLRQTIGLILSRWAGDGQFKCIGEKTPENALDMWLLGRAVPDAKFIHVIRDGRDEVVFAWEFSKQVLGDKLYDEYPDFAAFSEGFSKKWSAGVGRAHRFGRANPDCYMEVRCDKIYLEPAPVIAELLEYLGMEAGDATVSGCVEAGMNGASPGGSSVNREKYFDDDSLRVFHRYSGELLKLLDYEV